jgi:hypothetical protein
MKKCSSCGYINREENNFCAKCGKVLVYHQPLPQSAQPSVYPAKVIIGIIALLLIVGFMLWSFNNTPGLTESEFTIQINSDTNWSGAIGGLGGQRTVSGTGSTSFTIDSSIVSACIQKQTGWGALTVSISNNGKVVARQTTDAAYGVVTVSAPYS